MPKLIDTFNFNNSPEILKLEEEINCRIIDINSLSFKKYSDIFISNISLFYVWKDNIFTEDKAYVNYSTFPGIEVFSKHSKDTGTFYSGYNLIQGLKEIDEKVLIELNNKVRDTSFHELLGSSKKIYKNGEVIHETPWWDELKEWIIQILDILNHGVRGEYRISLLALFNYLFLHVHPFGDGNGRLWRILSLYQLTNKLNLDIPCFFSQIFINDDKTHYYKLLWDIDAHKEASLELYIKWYLENTISQLDLFFKCMKDILRYIDTNIYSQELPDTFYEKLYYRVDSANSEEIHFLSEFCLQWNIEFYKFEKYRYYFDRSFIEIFKKISVELWLQ